MAQATDANISKLQQMFPKVEGDVIAILLNDCENDMDKCVTYLLELSPEVSVNSTSPAPRGVDHALKVSTQGRCAHSVKSVSPKKGGGEREVWQEPPSTKSSNRNRQKHGKSNTSKSSVNSTKSDRSKVFTGSHGNKGTPQSRPQLKGSDDKPNTSQPQEDIREQADTGASEKSGRRQQQGHSQYPGGGGPQRPTLLPAPGSHPGPRGVMRPPGIFHPPRQNPPNLQYYHNERPPMWPDPVRPWPDAPYPAHHSHSQPRLIGPGGIPVAHGRMPFRPSGMPMVNGGIPLGPNGTSMALSGMTAGPGRMPLVRSGMTIRPGGTPMAHGGMTFRPGGTPVGMTVRPGGIPMAHNGMTIGPNGRPMAYGGTLVAYDSNQEQEITQLHRHYVHGLSTEGSGMSDSHNPILPDHEITEEKVEWPIDTVSESGMGLRRTNTPQHGTRPGSSLEEAGREWLNWTEDTDTASYKRLVLLRGLPGSGKSTIAREVVGEHGIICSTDDFFIVNGRYEFDPSKLSENHEKNREIAHEAMLIEITPVVIDNTNVSAWEMKPYVELAQSLQYEVEVIETSTPWRFDCAELARRNSHSVPIYKIEKMLSRYEHRVTVESILASRPPHRDKAPTGSTWRSNHRDSGHGSHMTSHMMPVHAQRQSASQTRHSHKQPVSKFPVSSSTVVSTATPSSRSTATQSSTAGGSDLRPQSCIPSTSSTSLLTLLHQSETSTVSGREHRHSPSPSLLLSPPPAQEQSLPSVGHSTQTYHDPPNRRDIKDSEAKPSQPSPSNPSSSDAGSVALSPLRVLTKVEKEERAAKMSRIWGDGRLSDDTEAHLEWERRGRGGVSWGGSEGVWGDKGGVPLPGTVWNRLDPVGVGAGDHSIQDGFVGRGHPSPCEFGPIGKIAKKTTTVPTVDNSGTTIQTKVDKNSEISDMHVRVSPETMAQNSPSAKNGQQSQEQLLSPPKNRSASAELWVSEEIENWTHEGALDDILVEGTEEKKQMQSSTGTPSSPPTSLKPPQHTPTTLKPPQHSHREASGVVSEGIPTSGFEQAGTDEEIMSDSSFEDVAIIVKQRAPPLGLTDSTVPQQTAGTSRDKAWEDGVDLESESQKPLFAKPSPETSPEIKQHGVTHPLPPSSCVASLFTPAGVYTSNSSAPTATSSSDVTTTKAESANCSTPTPIPPGDDDSDGGLVMVLGDGEKRGNKGYFPSAFESEMQVVDAEYSEVSGEIPGYDITITSSAMDDHSDCQTTPVNCVSTAPAAWPSLLPVDDATEVTKEDCFPLEASVSNVQESSGDSGKYRPCLSSPAMAAAPQGKVEGGGVCAINEPSDPQSDLGFLAECFPDLSRSFLCLLLQQSQGNVEEAVSTALMSIPESDSEVFGHTFSSLAYGQVHARDKMRLDLHGASSSAASITSESEMEGTVNGDLFFSDDDECVNDEQIARLIQEQLNFENFEETGLQTVKRVTRVEGEGKGEECTVLGEVLEDDNLVLRLSRSLASQLQQMFGSVTKHLPQEEGVLRDEDLQVLLSERAAYQIWRKWIDTLEAKKIELQLHQATIISRTQSAPVMRAVSDSEPPARSGTEPGPSSNLVTIMKEQTAQLTSVKEVNKMVKTVCDETMARKENLKQLYGRFRYLDKDAINYTIYKNNFNFSSAAQELEEEAAREDSADGTPHTSQSSLSSFAHSIKKPAVTSGKVGRSVRTARAAGTSKRKRRSRASAAQLKRNTEAVSDSFQDKPSYDSLRAEAALHAKLRSEAFQKAAHARSIKQGDVAVFYAQQGHSHTEKMKEANRRAADLILKLQNDLSSQKLDLHGLHVEEAIAALHEKLTSTTDADGVLYVITGKGIHSKGEAKLRPAVSHFLKNKNYTFEEQPGRFKVKLT